MLDTIRKTLHIIGRERRWRWILLTAMAAVQTGLEMLGALLVFVLLALVADPQGEIGLPLVGDVRGIFAGVDDQTFILATLITLGVFFVARAAFHVLVVYAQVRVSQNLGAALSIRLTLGYLGMDYTAYVRRNTAELLRNAGSAVSQLIVNAVTPLIKLVADAFVAIGLLAVMFAVSPLATGMAILIIGGSQVLLLLVVQPRLKRHGQVTHEMSKRTIGSLQQALYGFRDVRLLGRERPFAAEYARSRREEARISTQRGTALALPPVLLEIALLGFILVFFGVALVAGMATEQVLSVLGLFAYAGLRLQPTLNRVVSGLNEIRFSTASVDEIAEELELIRSRPEPPPPHDDVELPWTRLAFEDVSFAYDEALEPALRDVDLEIVRGEAIGICGPTGGGKSTLVDLMAGLLAPTTGRVTLDGRDLGASTRDWQAQLGVVSQMVFLTDDTVRRNIALGVPDDQIDDEALQRAVDLAQMTFVDSLPDGLDTRVGERGIRISGGQRQRIAIARALYRRVEFLIFDEGTSALDNATERQFMEALASLRRGHTIVMVAHRLSTVESCDRIVFVEDGRIAGVGTYEELVRDVPGFRALATSLQRG